MNPSLLQMPTTALRDNWPDRAAECARRWRLSGMEWSPGVSTAHIAFCDSPAGPAVLKVSVEPAMVGFEARALSYFGADLCPHVYAVDEDLGALLLERIDVQEDLSAWYPDPEREVNVWLPFFQAISAKPSSPEGFPTLADYSRVFERVLAKPIDSRIANLMRYGRDRQAILMAGPGENRLLHGDMHHFNLLRDSGERWRLIDPHGVIGHPLYELGAFLRNPWGSCYAQPDVEKRLAARVAILSARLDLPMQVVAEYGFYGAAFSIAWSLEDRSDDIDGMVVMAEACLRLGV